MKGAHTVSTLGKESERGVGKAETLGGEQSMTIVSEAGIETDRGYV